VEAKPSLGGAFASEEHLLREALAGDLAILLADLDADVVALELLGGDGRGTGAEE
jgi:hypothetical protein